MYPGARVPLDCARDQPGTLVTGGEVAILHDAFLGHGPVRSPAPDALLFN